MTAFCKLCCVSCIDFYALELHITGWLLYIALKHINTLVFQMKVHELEQQSKETQNLPFISYASHTPAESLSGVVCGSKAERKAEADPLLLLEDDR